MTNIYIEQLTTKILNQIIYDFPNILRDHDTLLNIALDFQNINQSIH